MANGDARAPLTHLTRAFVGKEFDVDVPVVLERQEVPWCRLDDAPTPGAYLGWNTWIRTGELTRDVDDTTFELDRG